MMVLFRLDSMFNDTPSALSRRSLYMLQISITMIPIVSTASLIIDEVYTTPSFCINSWDAPDISYDLTYCEMSVLDLLTFKYHVVTGCIAAIAALNILFAVLFTRKVLYILRKEETRTSTPREGHRSRSSSLDKRLTIEHLVVQEDLITVFAAISTIIGKLTCTFRSSVEMMFSVTKSWFRIFSRN